MSRIVVKNLPKKISEEKLRKIFSDKGLITDVQLKYTPDGKFRRFGFIGYQTDESAQEAIKYFNNTRIDTSKISVELCSLLGDENKPKAWSKYSADSTHNKLHKSKDEVKKKGASENNESKPIDKTSELLHKYKDDSLFEEFLEAQQSNAAKDLLLKVQKINVEKEDVNESSEEEETEKDIEDEAIDSDKPANQDISDMEYMKSLMSKSKSDDKTVEKTKSKKPKEAIKLFTLKLKGLPYTSKKKEIKQFFKPLKPYSIRVPQQIKGIAYVGFKLEKQFKKALLKDKSFISGKRISVIKYDVKDPNEPEIVNTQKMKWKNQEQSLRNEESIAESGRIFIRNLSYTTIEEDIDKLFAKFGPLTEVNLPIDLTSRKHKGFGVITFLMPEHAVKAYVELDGTILHGRMLHLLPGKAKDNPNDTLNEDSTNFKKKKEQELKAKAGSGHNWNSLFLGHDSVAEVIANTYSTTKENVLDPHGNANAAVRLALGETQIIHETRKYLEKEGVILDAFTGVTNKRSKTAILVKNLPATTQLKELNELFSPHGIINRIILPPSGISAIVEFMEPSEARKAFTRLAYTKFKNLPLYLEWAPDNCLTSKINQTNEANNNTIAEAKNVPEEKTNETKVEIKEKDDTESDEEETPEADTTIFVKNLNFITTDADLYKHFENCGKLKYATVSLKRDKNDQKKKLSMGYGFVQYMHKSSADKALKTLQQSLLHDKSLELKRSERTLATDLTATRKLPPSTQKKQTGTKILVRNIPFQAKKSEILELFKTFGEIKALRLPKKINSEQHRGFAFVDYSTKSEAKLAFEQLSQSTHLYGRRLVLEWASIDSNVEDIRKRTADHFHKHVETKSNKKGVLSIE